MLIDTYKKKMKKQKKTKAFSKIVYKILFYFKIVCWEMEAKILKKLKTFIKFIYIILFYFKTVCWLIYVCKKKIKIK